MECSLPLDQLPKGRLHSILLSLEQGQLVQPLQAKNVTHQDKPCRPCRGRGFG